MRSARYQTNTLFRPAAFVSSAAMKKREKKSKKLATKTIRVLPDHALENAKGGAGKADLVNSIAD